MKSVMLHGGMNKAIKKLETFKGLKVILENLDEQL